MFKELWQKIGRLVVPSHYLDTGCRDAGSLRMAIEGANAALGGSDEQELTQWFASRRACTVVTIPCEGRCICRDDAKAFMARFG